MITALQGVHPMNDIHTYPALKSSPREVRYAARPASPEMATIGYGPKKKLKCPLALRSLPSLRKSPLLEKKGREPMKGTPLSVHDAPEWKSARFERRTKRKMAIVATSSRVLADQF